MKCACNPFHCFLLHPNATSLLTSLTAAHIVVVKSRIESFPLSQNLIIGKLLSVGFQTIILQIQSESTGLSTSVVPCYMYVSPTTSILKVGVVSILIGLEHIRPSYFILQWLEQWFNSLIVVVCCCCCTYSWLCGASLSECGSCQPCTPWRQWGAQVCWGHP